MAKWTSLPEDSRLYITALTLAELYYGAFSSDNPDKRVQEVESLVLDFNILDFGPEAARLYGRIKSQLRKAGRPIPDTDLLIASIVLAENLTLVTHNLKHFQRISDLKLEDWLA